MDEARILIVEDEHIVAWDLERRLTCLGYTVVGTISSGEEAILKALELKPDIVLMDIRLAGEMDGVDAAEHIRARMKAAIIYMTAYGDEPTLQRTQESNRLTVMRKPFQNEALQKALDEALRGAEG